MKWHWIKLAVLATVHLLALCWLSIGNAQGVIAPGETRTGVITPIGDSDTWTFAATAGDHILIRVGTDPQPSGITPRTRLFDPSGTLFAIATGLVTEIDVVAATTGIFSLVIDDALAKAFQSYRVTLVKSGSTPVVAIGDQGGPLTNGAEHLGSIEVGELDVWTVTATPGESIVVRMRGPVPWIRIYSPNGTLLDSDFSSLVAEVAVTAAVGGTFMVVVGDGSPDLGASGPYMLTLAKTGSAVVVSANDQGGALTNGVTRAAEITLGDMDLWTIDATAGDTIIVRMGVLAPGSTLTPWLRIYGPSGALLDSSSLRDIAGVEVRAPASGTYLVVAADGSSGLDGTGTYRLTMAKTGSPLVAPPFDEGGPLTNGAMHLGELKVGDMDLWTVDANAGDSIVVRMGKMEVGSPLAPYLGIYSPSGDLLAASGFTGLAEVAVTAAASGTYLVVALDGSYNGAGFYRITLAKTGSAVVVSPGDQGGPLANGAMHTGIIDVGDLDVWTINAVIGEKMVVRMGGVTADTALQPSLRIYSPGGALLNSISSLVAVEEIVTADASGTFLVVVADARNFAGGSASYRLTLAKMGSAVVVSPGDEGGPLTNGAMHTGVIDVSDLDVWTVPANAGDTVVVRMGKAFTFSTLTPHIRIFSPTGALLGSNYSSQAAEVAVTAAESGTFMVIAGDRSNSYSGSGSYRLTLAKTGTPVTVSPGDEGGPLPAGITTATLDVGDLDVWTISASSGDQLIVTMDEVPADGPLTPWLRIFDPSGALVGDASAAATAQLSVTATSGGTFVVVATDASPNFGGSGAYRLTTNGATGAGAVPVLISAVSRKVHAAAGAFDLALSLVSTSPTVEPRQGATATVVMTFGKAITGANVIIGEGTAIAALPTFNGGDVSIGLTGISDAQYTTVTLTDVSSADGGVGGSGSVRIGFLAGDVNQNRAVTVSDLLAVNAALAQGVTAANFLRDVNVSGTLSLADLLFVNSRLTHMLPPP